MNNLLNDGENLLHQVACLSQAEMADLELKFQEDSELRTFFRSAITNALAEFPTSLLSSNLQWYEFIKRNTAAAEEDTTLNEEEITKLDAKLKALIGGFSAELSLKLESKTKELLDGIRKLLEGDSIENQADRQIIEAAIAFIEQPEKVMKDIKEHTTNVGNIVVEYEMSPEDALPPKINALYSYLLSLQCINRISFVERMLKKNPPDKTKIEGGLNTAESSASILANEYKDGTFIDAVKLLRITVLGVQ